MSQLVVFIGQKPAGMTPDQAMLYRGVRILRKLGDRVMVAGTAPIWPDGHVDPDPEEQASRCLEIMLGALTEAGATPADVVRTRSFVTDAGVQDAVGRAHGRIFGAIRPASTMVVVAGLVDDRWKVEMEAEAIIGSAAGHSPDDA